MSERAHAGADTKKTVYAALGANPLIAVAKFVAGFLSGSAAMLAEGAHSVADTTNQVFLLVSLRTSRRKPDEEHPYGYGQDRFFWSFLVAVLIFFVGALFSLYQGITALLRGGEGHESFLLNYVVLGVAFVFEGTAFAISVREFRRAARGEGHSFLEHFRSTRNTTMKVPLYEDAAALTGLAIAAAGLLLAQATGNDLFDGLASIGVGCVLLVVAWELGRDSRALLLGEAVLPEGRERIHEAMLSFPEVTEVFRLLTMHLGPDEVLVNAEIHIADGLDTEGVEELLERVTRKIREEVPEVSQTFIEPIPRSDGARERLAAALALVPAPRMGNPRRVGLRPRVGDRGLGPGGRTRHRAVYRPLVRLPAARGEAIQRLRPRLGGAGHPPRRGPAILALVDARLGSAIVVGGGGTGTRS